MTIFRVVFFSYYSELDSFSNFIFDIAKMLFLGFRIDLTVIGYIQVIPTLFIIALFYLNKDKFFKIFQNFLIYYLFIFYFIVTLLFLADFLRVFLLPLFLYLITLNQLNLDFSKIFHQKYL
jgi:hypothetical protein